MSLLVKTLLIASSLVLASSGLAVGLRRGWTASTILWTAGGLVYLLVSILLSLMGEELFTLKITPIVGSLYPALLSAGIVAANTRYWKHYIAFAAVMLAGITLGVALDLAPLKGATHGILHSVSGLLLVLLPLYYYQKGLTGSGAIVLSLGGLIISIGGVALALSAIGIEAANVIVEIALYPVLIASPLALGVGYYLSLGLGRG